jgi:hypothetical protein
MTGNCLPRSLNIRVTYGTDIDQFVKLCSINARILKVFKAFDERKASSIHGNTSPKLIFGGILPD